MGKGLSKNCESNTRYFNLKKSFDFRRIYLKRLYFIQPMATIQYSKEELTDLTSSGE